MTPDEMLDAILTLPQISDTSPRISPDGSWVAWTWFRVAPAADVYAAPTDGSRPPLRLTETPDNTLLVSWTPDSKAVIVEQDNDGNERAQLFRVDLERPLVMVPLTEAQPAYYIRGGQLHPNRRWLVYAANYDFTTGAEIEPSWVYRHDLHTGERVALAKSLKSCYSVPQLNLPGTHILYFRKDLHPAGYQTWLVDIEGQEDREILNFGPEVRTYARWFPDGQRALIWVDTPTHRRLGVLLLGRDKIHWLLDDPGRDIETAFVPPGTQQVVVVENSLGRTRCALLDVQTMAEEVLPAFPGNLIPLGPVPVPARHPGTANQASGWVGFYYSSRQPTDLVRFSLDDLAPGRFSSLTHLWERTALQPDDFTQASDFSWKSVDGQDIHGWLYRPKGQVHGTVVYIHGGPTWHSQDWINATIQYFAAVGFNVLDINYRGSTGYGMAFREAIKVDGWGGREMEDIRTGIQALLTAGIAQEGKIGITGTSYGGYASWWAITHFPPNLVAASAPICGMTDLVIDYETTRPDLRPYSAEMMGGTPDQVPERFYQRSPIHFVEDIRGKLLIVQGAQDPNVTPKNVAEVIQRLDQAAIPYEVLTFQDEGHGISKTPNQRRLLQRLQDFFQRAFSSP